METEQFWQLVKRQVATLPQYGGEEPEVSKLAAVLKKLPGFEIASESDPNHAYHNVVRLVALARQRGLTLEGAIAYIVEQAKEHGMSISKALTQETAPAPEHSEASVIAYIDTPLYTPEGLPIKVTGRAGVSADQIVETVWSVAEAGRRLLEEGYYTKLPSPTASPASTSAAPPAAEGPKTIQPPAQSPAVRPAPARPQPQTVASLPNAQVFQTSYGPLALEQRVDALVTALKLVDETNKFGKPYVRLQMRTQEGVVVSIPGWNDAERKRMTEFFEGGNLSADYWLNQAPRDNWIELPNPVYVALKVARNKDGSPRRADDGTAYLDYAEVISQ